MNRADRLLDRLPAPAIRALALLGFLGLFFAAASLIKPEGTRATTLRPDAEPQTAPTVAGQPGGPMRSVPLPALLGTLNGVDYSIEVYLTRQGPRYTVLTTAGRRIAELLTEGELYERFPELDVQRLQAGQVGEADVEIDQ